MNSPSPHNPPYPSRRYAWFVVFLLIIASLVAFMDRQIVAIVVGPMQRDLGVGDTQISWLYGIHALFYALPPFQLPASQIREAVNTLLQ